MAVNPPYLLIDIDGVLNPFPGPGGSLPPDYQPHRVDLNGTDVPVWLNPDHGSWITELHSTGLVRPIWATSWQSAAARTIGPRLGLDAYPHIDLGPTRQLTRHPNGYLWKRDAVATWADQAPLVWIDDDFAHPDHEWARQRALNGVPTLLIQPDPYQGLRRAHIDAVRTWALAVTRNARTNGDRDDVAAHPPPLAAAVHASRGTGSY